MLQSAGRGQGLMISNLPPDSNKLHPILTVGMAQPHPRPSPNAVASTSHQLCATRPPHCLCPPWEPH